MQAALSSHRREIDPVGRILLCCFVVKVLRTGTRCRKDAAVLIRRFTLGKHVSLGDRALKGSVAQDHPTWMREGPRCTRATLESS